MPPEIAPGEATAPAGPSSRPSPPLLVVISGPSGAGKDSVIRRLKERDRSFHHVVTATTRAPRPGEQEGIDYWFLSERDFEALLSSGGFIEHARVYGRYYGVPRQQIADALASGKDVLMRVDVQGARTIRALAPEAVLIFLAAASHDDLAGRLSARPGDDEGSVRERLDTVSAEMREIDIFDYLVVNEQGGLDQAVATIEAIIAAEHARVAPRRVTLQQQFVSEDKNG